MGTKKSKFWTLVLYNGSTDERNQSLYDRAGYFSFVFLFAGLVVTGLYKLFVLRIPSDQLLPEIVLLALSALLLTGLCIRFGVTLFQNKAQKRTIRNLLLVLGFVMICLVGYVPLWLNLPNARFILSLGLGAWFVPPLVALVGVSAIWLLTTATDRLGKRSSAKHERHE